MSNWKIADKINADSVVLQLLHNRGLTTPEQIEDFLHPQYENLHDPFLFRDMDKFVSRIREAVNSGEVVFVYGDYDADGVCSAVLLSETLKRVGVKQVEVYLPHREREGYGLNVTALEYIVEQGAALVITVDCGSSNVGEVLYGRERGLDIMILDHHEEPPVKPEGVTAFINPQLSGETYPFKNLAAVGVVFKAAQALWQAFGLPVGEEKWFLDLAAIATVTDMMPLLDENRILVKYGLVVLNKTRRLGLEALIKAMNYAGGDLGVYEVGFMIGPRLNAAGRIDHANAAYELLETTDQEIANDLAASLNAANIERQTATERILRQALAQVEPQAESNLVLTAIGDNWPVGVVGLVASKITERFHRPSLVITRADKGLTGSGRSIPGFNITEALRGGKEHLTRFGGHEGACGFTLISEEALAPFRADMNKAAVAKLQAADLAKVLKVDMELDFNQVDFDLLNDLDSLSPYGIANPRPRFASLAARVADIFLMGNDKQHMKLKLEQGNKIFSAVGFGLSRDWAAVLRAGDLIDVVYELDINEWQGRREIQMKIVDIKKI